MGAQGISLDDLAVRQWPPEGASAPEPGEASLVSAYRNLSDEGRGGGERGGRNEVHLPPRTWFGWVGC